MRLVIRRNMLLLSTGTDSRRKGVGLHYKRFWPVFEGAFVDLKRLVGTDHPHFCCFGGRVVKVGLGHNGHQIYRKSVYGDVKLLV
jgi:hypothetical protein